jgi:hypothetical protein
VNTAASTSAFSSLGHLYTPATRDTVSTAVIEAEDSWSLKGAATSEADVVVWGRLPMLPQTPVLSLSASALRREFVLAKSRVRGLDSLRIIGVHRLEPPSWRGGVVRNALRQATLGGAILELSRVGRTHRVLDAVIEAAGAQAAEGAKLRPSYEGSALGAIGLEPGVSAILRVAAQDSPAGPQTAADALRALEKVDLDSIPRLFNSDVTCGAAWTTETLLSGRRPKALTEDLSNQVARLCAQFPASDSPATSLRERLSLIGARIPKWAATLRNLEEAIDDVVAGSPSVLQHGDLWTGNLLVSEGRLTGLVDWDGWHPAGLPGVDLLHLLIAEQRMDNLGSLGHVWSTRPWESSWFRLVSEGYWRTLGLHPSPRHLFALGVDWWASRIANYLSKAPYLMSDERWVVDNVNAVLHQIERDL